MDTDVLYCDDNLERLSAMPDESVDLIYLDPPFFSNRTYEVIWGDEAEVRSFEDRWEGGIQHYIDWMKQRAVELHRVLKPTGSLYLHCDPHASHHLKIMLDGIFGVPQFRNEIVWKRSPFSGSSKAKARQYPRSHDLLFLYSKGSTWTWNGPTVPYSAAYLKRFKWNDHDGRGPYRKTLLKTYSDETFDRLKADNRLIKPIRKNAKYSYKQYLSESSGTTQIDDVWVDINSLNPVARERLGYPTQKPEALLERVLTASSNPGDVVLDPFCGCGTTVAVAQRMKRPWIGIDVSTTAMRIMDRRFRRDFGIVPKIVNMPSSEQAVRELKPFEFQNWVIDTMNGSHSPRKSRDGGIDGYSFFSKDPIQVKQSEHVGRVAVDQFETAMQRGGHEVGYIVGFSFTKDAYEEVAKAKARGLNIKLVKVKEVLLLAKRPDSPPKTLAPQPAGDVLPMPEKRKAKDLPTVAELVASDTAS